MKKWVSLVAVFCMFVGIAAYAGQPGRLAKGRYIAGEVELPITSFILTNSANGDVVMLSTTSAPGIEYDDYQANLVWSDGETTPAEATFRVPSNYNGDGEFRAMFTRSGTGDAPSIDYEVYVNRDLATIDSSATAYDAIELLPGYVTSPQQVVFSVTDSIRAGDIVTFREWRDDTDTSTDDLEQKGSVLFVYTPLN